MKIVLVGYMGSGKSSVGQALASVLNFEFVDLDEEIEKIENTSIADIFSRKGEIYFRKKENEYIKTLLEKNDQYILATGGGTPCYGNTMEVIRNSKDVVSIYLKCSLDTLTNRLFYETKERPLIAHLHSKEDLQDFIRKHLFERSYYYNQATLSLDCDQTSIKEIVEALVLKLF